MVVANPGVVDEDRDLGFAVVEALPKGVDGGFVGNVKGGELEAFGVCAELGAKRFGGSLILAVRRDHARAALEESEGDRPANAARATGDDDGVGFKVHAWEALSPAA